MNPFQRNYTPGPPRSADLRMNLRLPVLRHSVRTCQTRKTLVRLLADGNSIHLCSAMNAYHVH